MLKSLVYLCLFISFIAPLVVRSEAEAVLTLDATNFTEIVSKHQFIVVEFYAPWCGHCKKLEPEYEKAASLLKDYEHPVALAKVDANEEKNKELASKFEVQGFPTLKIIKNGGVAVQDYKGPREADGIVSYLKKQAGPASVELKCLEDVNNFISENAISIVGVFPKFFGDEFVNFTTIAEKLRSDYDFGHTLEATNLPQGEAGSGPLIRLFKPFDEKFVDFQDFHVDVMAKFIEEASIPMMTIFNKDPANHPFVIKLFSSPEPKALFFVNFTDELFETFKAEYHDIASSYRGQGMRFLLGDLEASGGAFQFFGLKQDQAPLIIVQKDDKEKYLKTNLEPGNIVPWLKDYMEGKVLPFRRSEPIPEDNSGPIKVVVADSLQDVFFNSGANVLLEFYAPWCGHCQKLMPVLEEVATSFQNDKDVVIAKLDATANDIPTDTFDVKGYPTLYFSSASGKVMLYDGDRSKEDIIDFIKKNRDPIVQDESTTEPLKDEL